MKLLVNQPINQSTNQSTDQPVNQSVNRWINQSINRMHIHKSQLHLPFWDKNPKTLRIFNNIIILLVETD
jgi:hypothetical protein